MSPDELQPDAGSCGQDAAPYVLGALTESDRTGFALHLESCVVCREEVSSLRSVVAALPAAVPQRAAPRELKSRVMATVKSEAALRRNAGAGAGARGRHRALPRLVLGRPLASLAGVAAAAAAVIAIVLVPGGDGSSSRLIHAQVSVPRANVSVRLEAGHAELNVADMPQTTPDHVYEVWVEKAGAPQPTDALFTVSTAGSATVGVPGSVTGLKEILVTSEPTGGSKVPTGRPLIVAHLS